MRYIRNGCAKKGEATLLAKLDCTEIERAEARVLLSEAVAPILKLSAPPPLSLQLRGELNSQPFHRKDGEVAEIAQSKTELGHHC